MTKTNQSTIENPVTLKQWLRRSIGWSVSLHGIWWLILLIVVGAQTPVGVSGAEDDFLYKILVVIYITTWWKGLYGFDLIIKNDVAASSRVKRQATVWRLVLIVYQIVVLPFMVLWVSIEPSSLLKL